MCQAILIGGIGNVVERWMGCGFKESSEQIAAAIMELSEIVTAELTKK